MAAISHPLIGYSLESIVNLERQLGSRQGSSKHVGKLIVLLYGLMLHSFAKVQYYPKMNEQEKKEIKNRAEDEEVSNVVAGVNLQKMQLRQRAQPHKVWTQILHCATRVHAPPKRALMYSQSVET